MSDCKKSNGRSLINYKDNTLSNARFIYNVSSLLCLNLVNSVFAENDFLKALKADYCCAHCVKNIVLLSQSEQFFKAVQNLVYLRYTIFWEIRNSRNLNSRFDNSYRIYDYDSAHAEISFSVQTISYVFQDWKTIT